MRKATPILLEPMMAVEVETPEDYMGDVMGDLNRRRGIIQGMDDVGGVKAIKAEVPLAEMFGYSTICARCRRVARPIRWNSSITPKHRKASQKPLLPRSDLAPSNNFDFIGYLKWLRKIRADQTARKRWHHWTR